MSAYSLDLRKKIVESVNKGVPKSETARRFGVDRATVKRYCKQLDERGTLEPRKAPGKRPKLDEKAMKLLVEDLEERPWATHFQRAQFLFALSGVRVSRWEEHTSELQSRQYVVCRLLLEKKIANQSC